MTKMMILVLAAYFGLLAAYLIFAPRSFYETVPGVSDTGPFNSHFTRDVGFAFLVSATALLFAAIRRDRTLGLFGATFPVLHAVFHVLSWGHHSFPMDSVAVMDILGSAGLAAFTFFMASRIDRSAA